MHDIKVLGYSVYITDAGRPATITDTGTNAKPSGKKNSHRQSTSSKSADTTTTSRCVFCGNDPKAQVKLGITPHCDLQKMSCANYNHPDCNKSGGSSFEESDIGKKYAALGKKRFIISNWRYDHATTRPSLTIKCCFLPSNILVSNGESRALYYVWMTRALIDPLRLKYSLIPDLIRYRLLAKILFLATLVKI